jgi:uncharacterized membrane protein YoaK (UPF0700 family)
VTAAAVDAVTFLGLGHAFSALATGNVLLVGFGVARAGPILAPATALAAFVTGVAAAHLLIARVNAHGRRWFIVALAAEVTVLGGAGGYATAISGTQGMPTPAMPIVVALLAGAMGWRNRTMVQAAIPDMPTTVLQTTLVKVLSDVLTFRSAASRDSALTHTRRTATLLGIFIGGLLGALLLRLGPGPALLVIAGLEAGVTGLYARAPRLRPQPREDGHDQVGPANQVPR